MHIDSRVPHDQRAAVAQAMGCELIVAREDHGVLLRPAQGRDDYRSANRSGRRLWACTFAGHYVFMRAIFTLDPTAKISSTVVSYDGLEDFKANAFARNGHRPGFRSQAPDARQAKGHVEWRSEADLEAIAVEIARPSETRAT